MKRIIISLIILLASSNFAIAQETDQNTDSVQQNVDQRLDEVRNRLKALIGTVTDKTENTMQLETEQHEIGLVSINENATYASTNGSSSTIEFDDVGIGDFVISMGTFDSNNVMIARRIVVSGQPKEIDQEVFYGTVLDFEDDLIVQNIPDSTELIISINRSVMITEINEEGAMTRLSSNSLDPNDKIIIIGIKHEDSIEASRIHIVEQAPEEE